jgi:hypothetical protein
LHFTHPKYLSTRTASLQEKHDTLDTCPEWQGRVLNVRGKSGAFLENAEVANNLVTMAAEGVAAASAVDPQVRSWDANS